MSHTIWTYTKAEHENFAPHISNNLISLATCMPFIRDHAQIGEWVMGMTTASMGAIRASYLMRVDDVMLRDKYWTEHPGRIDNIYRPVPAWYEQIGNVGPNTKER